jgi:plasmid stabilization system protein ParE
MKVKAKVGWTHLAIDDLDSIRRYIEFDDPRAAVSMARGILQATARLSTLPSVGRPGRVINTRELVLEDRPYLVAYRVTAGVVEVLRVLHTSRRWPRRLQ